MLPAPQPMGLGSGIVPVIWHQVPVLSPAPHPDQLSLVDMEVLPYMPLGRLDAASLGWHISEHLCSFPLRRCKYALWHICNLSRQAQGTSGAVQSQDCAMGVRKLKVYELYSKCSKYSKYSNVLSSSLLQFSIPPLAINDFRMTRLAMLYVLAEAKSNCVQCRLVHSAFLCLHTPRFHDCLLGSDNTTMHNKVLAFFLK